MTEDWEGQGERRGWESYGLKSTQGQGLGRQIKGRGGEEHRCENKAGKRREELEEAQQRDRGSNRGHESNAKCRYAFWWLLRKAWARVVFLSVHSSWAASAAGASKIWANDWEHG